MALRRAGAMLTINNANRNTGGYSVAVSNAAED
jgi:hypothetical protein